MRWLVSRSSLSRAATRAGLLVFVLIVCPVLAAQPAAPTAPPPTDAPTDVVRRTTLIVHDIDASLRFYRDVLGFTLWLDNRGKVGPNSLPVDLPPGAPSRFAVLKGRHPWVGMIGLLQYGDPRQAPPPRAIVGPGDAVLMIETTDLRGIHARMQSAKTTILRAPETSEVTGAGGARWKATFLFAYDPDGHLLEINQRESLVGGDAKASAAAATPKIHRGFFDGRFGQLHYRRIDPVAATSLQPPIVLLHQTPLSGRMFTEILAPLARNRTVYALDTPGYGESDAPPAVPKIADYGDALHDFIGDLKEPVDWVSHGCADCSGYRSAPPCERSQARVDFISAAIRRATCRARHAHTHCARWFARHGRMEKHNGYAADRAVVRTRGANCRGKTARWLASGMGDGGDPNTRCGRNVASHPYANHRCSSEGQPVGANRSGGGLDPWQSCHRDARRLALRDFRCAPATARCTLVRRARVISSRRQALYGL
jgi:catechol 2,3-dioxygenase-like lactoylglutathione lyase family enzyme